MKGQLPVHSGGPRGLQMLSIERQFIRTERPLYGHLVTLLESAIAKRRAAVGHARPARSAPLPSSSRSAARRSSAPIASSNRAGCCAATSAAARSSARPRNPKGRRSPGAARSPRRRCAPATRRCATSSATPSDARLLSLAAGEPALDRFPNEAFLEAVSHALATDSSAVWGHGPTEGQPALRTAIADRYGVPRESVLILSGAQQGLDLLARCLIDPGDAVIMDRPGYLGAIQSFRAAGAKLIGWDIAPRRQRRARRPARALPPEADLHQSRPSTIRPA